MWFCASRSLGLTLPELPSLGTSNRSIFPSQEPCLRCTLSLGSFSIGENHVGKNTWTVKEWDIGREMTAYSCIESSWRFLDQSFKWSVNI